jgi:glycosyltransferase involved in cell wall biosynthesis
MEEYLRYPLDNSLDDRQRLCHAKTMGRYKMGMVSVIVPTYNRASLILETLESVYAQSYRPIELIIVDDGSTDNTRDIIKQWQNGLKNIEGFNIYYYWQENHGGAAARNFGLSKSIGEYVQFLDSDDLLHKNKIEAQVAVLLSNPAVQAVYCAWRTLFTSGILKYGPWCQKQAMPSEDSMLRGYISGSWFVPPHVFLFSRNLVDSIGLWDTKLVQGQDRDYVIRILINGCKFLHVPSVHVCCRRHLGDHVSSRFGKDKLKQRIMSSVRIMQKAYLALLSKGMAQMYLNEFGDWYQHIVNYAANFGEHVEISNLDRRFQKMLNERPAVPKRCVSYRILKGITGVYGIRLFRHMIGDCALAWMSAFFNDLKQIYKN